MRFILLTIYFLLSISKSFGAIQNVDSKVLRHARLGIAMESVEKKAKISSASTSSEIAKMDIDETEDLDAKKYSSSKIVFQNPTGKHASVLCNYINFLHLAKAEDNPLLQPHWQLANDRISPESIYILNEDIRI